MPRSPRSLWIAALAALLLLSPAAAQAASPFTALQHAVSAARPTLGAKTTKKLQARVARARRAYQHGQICSSLHHLGDLVIGVRKAGGDKVIGVRKAGGDPRIIAIAKVSSSARTLQRRIFVQRAARHGACGLRKPTVRVAKSVKPAVASFAGHPVARMKGDDGVATDFVADQVVVTTADTAKLNAFVARWHGKVLKSRATTHLVQVDAAHAPTDGVVEDLRKLDPAARGDLALSSAGGLKLVAVAADAAAHGLKVGPDFLPASTGVLDRSTAEQPGAGDAYSQWYNKPVDQSGLGVGEAWRTLAVSGKAANRVKLGVIDGGFANDATTMGDWPASVSGADNVPNPMSCTNGKACPFHGSNVASTAAGVVDNNKGVAGTGGQVADLVLVHAGTDEFDLIDGIYDAWGKGAKVINISSGWELDALVSAFNIPVEDATQTAREHGALVVASAGNDGRDVDAEDCFIVCWEEEWIAPCENDAVLCVGGIDANWKRDAGSNFGLEWCGNAQDCDVDLFAPWQVLVGPDGKISNDHNITGTSFSSPFVAGVAAMMLAVNPSLTPAQLEEGLRATASSSSDKTVSRIVDADAAVKWAFQGQHIAPAVRIVSPSPNHLSPYGGFNTEHFAAKLYTVGDDPSCCNVTWSSDVDGALGGGVTLDAMFGTPGKRTVTAKATDGAGAVATDTVPVEAFNDGPSASITAPAAGANLFRGQAVKFNGGAQDLNEPAGVKCASIHWSVKKAGAASPEFTADGCQPAYTPTSNGDRVVTLTATDERGATGTTSRMVHVVDPPLNAPPLVTILSPDDGAGLDPNDPVTLKASATDPDTGQPVAGTWSVKDGSTTKVIGNGNTVQWTPSDDVPFHCGGSTVTLIFSATDSDGTSKDQIDVHINNPPC